jgi:hypothetical protein
MRPLGKIRRAQEVGASSRTHKSIADKERMCCVVRQAGVTPPRLNAEGAGERRPYIQPPKAK